MGLSIQSEPFKLATINIKLKGEFTNCSSVSILEPEPYLRLTGRLSNLTRTIGSKVRLKCSFRGHPIPTIRWLKNEAPIESIRGKVTIRLIPSTKGRLTSRLLINNLDVHDTGYYKCEATNKFLTKETFGILVVTTGKNQFNLIGTINFLSP